MVPGEEGGVSRNIDLALEKGRLVIVCEQRDQLEQPKADILDRVQENGTNSKAEIDEKHTECVDGREEKLYSILWQVRLMSGDGKRDANGFCVVRQEMERDLVRDLVEQGRDVPPGLDQSDGGCGAVVLEMILLGGVETLLGGGAEDIKQLVVVLVSGCIPIDYGRLTELVDKRLPRIRLLEFASGRPESRPS